MIGTILLMCFIMGVAILGPALLAVHATHKELLASPNADLQAQIRKLEAQLGLVQVCRFCRDRRLYRIIWVGPFMVDTDPLPMDSPLCEDCGAPFRPYLEG